LYQKNTLSFAFLGSQASLLSEMFTARQRPFFQAAKIIQLGPIDCKSLKSYIRRRFLSVGRKVDNIEDFIPEWQTSPLRRQRVLSVLAEKGPLRRVSAVSLAEYEMTHTSFNTALKQLIQKGSLREDENGNYCLADPIFRRWIARRAVG
jgi:hypothetical protein